MWFNMITVRIFQQMNPRDKGIFLGYAKLEFTYIPTINLNSRFLNSAHAYIQLQYEIKATEKDSLPRSILCIFFFYRLLGDVMLFL